VAVPLLLVTHYVTFVLLLRRWKNWAGFNHEQNESDVAQIL